MNPITITTRIAVACATLVIVSAGVLGYTALYDLFVSIGLFAPWLGIFFPLLFDLAEVTAAVSVFNAKLQGEDDRFAWRMVLLFTLLGIVANVAHAGHAFYAGRIDAAQLGLAVFATSLFPLSIALVTDLLKRVIARNIERQALLESLSELDKRRDTLTGQVDTNQAELDTLNADLDELVATLYRLRLDTGGDISGNVREMTAKRQADAEGRKRQALAMAAEGVARSDIAEALGVTSRTVKRYLNGQGVTP